MPITLPPRGAPVKEKRCWRGGGRQSRMPANLLEGSLMIALMLAAAGMAAGAGPLPRLSRGQWEHLRESARRGLTPRLLEAERHVFGPWHRYVERTAKQLGEAAQKR